MICRTAARMGGGQKGWCMIYKATWDRLREEIYRIKNSRPYCKQYSNDTVIDENKSIKWNREQFAQRNKELQAEYERAVQDREKRYSVWVREVCDLIISEIGGVASEQQALLIYRAAGFPEQVDDIWFDYCGVPDFEQDLWPFIELAKELLNNKE